MPRETKSAPSAESRRPPEKSFAERRDELFDKLAAMPGGLGELPKTIVVARVFEHSTEDGLRLAERLAFTPVEYQDALLDVGFAFKHRALFTELKNALPSDSSTSPEAGYYHLRVTNLPWLVNPELSGADALTSKGRKMLIEREERDSKRYPFADIDNLYVDAMMTRAPMSLKVGEKSQVTHQSKGERMAERYLDSMQEVLERRYYTGPIKERFRNLNLESISDFREPTVSEFLLRHTLEEYNLNADDIIKQLAPARVVAYRPLDALKRTTVSQELLKEIRAELPEDLEVSLDRESNEYRVGPKEGESLPENKGEKEQMDLAAFEKKSLKMMEELLKKGAQPEHVLAGLAGDGSGGAWGLRERLLKKGATSEDLARGFSGLDSPRAWDFREELFAKQVFGPLARSLSCLDSPRAWEMRKDLLEKRQLEGVAASLTGLDTPQAWEMRREVLEKLEKAPYNFPGTIRDKLAISLAGIDSPNASWFRTRISKEVEKHSRSIGVRSFIGVDSPDAWEMREKTLEKNESLDSIAASLAGLDTPRAWKMRRDLLDPVAKREMAMSLDEAIAISLAGCNSTEAWEMREDLLKKGTDPMFMALSLNGDYVTSVWRLKQKKEKIPKAERPMTDSERLGAFEEKAVKEMREWLEAGASPNDTAGGLAGCNSSEAEELRKYVADQSIILSSYTGCDSPEAWSFRDARFKITEKRDYVFYGLARSLAGLESDRAWEMRENLIKKGIELNNIAPGLKGCDSPRSWKMRKWLIEQNVDRGYIAESLAGVDSPDAMEMRMKFFDQGENLDSLAMSLTSLDSKEARDLRIFLRAVMKVDEQGAVLRSYAGIDSPEAWKVRWSYFHSKRLLDDVALSLAGLDSPEASQMRKDLRKLGVGPGTLAQSFTGNSTTFVWRLRKKPFTNQEKSEVAVDPRVEAKLKVLNLVRSPSIEGIDEYVEDHPHLRERPPPDLNASPFAADILVNQAFQDRDAARALLKTNAAVPDRAVDRLAQELLRRMLPSRDIQPSAFSRFLSYFRGAPDKLPLSRAFAESPSVELMGGGSENVSDRRRVLEAREEMDELLVGGVYGSYNDETRRWEKVYFPARSRPTGPTRETTLSLLHVEESGRVSLQLPLDARLITERVKGVTLKKKEISFETVTDSLGEASVDIPKGVTSVAYSIERPLAPEPLHDPSAKEYATFINSLQKEYGRSMSAPLASLPHDIEARVRHDDFKALSPKEKLMQIEQLVRELGWYDEKNEETRQEKLGKTPEEQIAVCESRLEDLRRGQSDPALENKRFAGVCADFAQITCALLRAAGIPSGILTGFHLKGTSAEMKDAHATAFVPWPDGQGGIRIVSVDGTPVGTTARTANIARPTLAELEAGSAQETSEEIADAKEIVAEAVKAAQAGDETKLREMQNGKLERALNVILHYEVKRSHLHAVEAMLNAYWYGGMARQEELESGIALRKIMEESIAAERPDTVGKEGEKRAGTELLETVREFVKRFQKDRKIASREKAFQTLDRIFDLSKGGLSDVERRAMTAVIAYLKAERIAR